jgi:hypothetical protein
MHLDPRWGRALADDRMVSNWLRTFARTHSPTVLLTPATPHRQFPTRSPWACPRLTKAMRPLIAKHLWEVPIRILTPRAIHHHHSASHRRRLRQPAEAASAQCHNTPPARIPINPPYPHHSYNMRTSLHHSHMHPCLLKEAAQDTPRPAFRLMGRGRVPRRSLAQDQEGQADQGDARRARRVDQALQSVARHPGTPLALGLVPRLLVSMTHQ